MSKVLKNIVKGVKKVFKKITKVVKKVLKSKIFKAILIAVAVYFTAGAAMGAMGAAGTAGATGTVAGGSVVGGAAANTVGGIMFDIGMGNMATAATLAPTAAATGISTGQALLATTALNMGGSALSASAAEKEAKEREKKDKARLLHNNTTDLNVLEDTRSIMQAQGEAAAQSQQGADYGQRQANGQGVYDGQQVAQDSKGGTVYQNQPVMQSVAQSAPRNVESTSPQYFNSSDNKWQKVR